MLREASPSEGSSALPHRRRLLFARSTIPIEDKLTRSIRNRRRRWKKIYTLAWVEIFDQIFLIAANEAKSFLCRVVRKHVYTLRRSSRVSAVCAPAMFKGLYKVEFETPRGKALGVVNAEDGKIRGGSSAFAYIGSFTENGHSFSGERSQHSTHCKSRTSIGLWL